MERLSALTRHLCSASAASSSDPRLNAVKNLNHGENRLRSKVAFITGAGSGIGRATAILFAQQGAKVYIVDYNSELLSETRQLVEQLIPTTNHNTVCYSKKCDVSNEKEVQNCIEDCVKVFGGLDICFANAGVTGAPIYFTDFSSSEFDKIFDVNVKGVFNCFKHASLYLTQKNKGGSLFATSSVAGIRSGAGDTIYSASKAAVISLTQTIANQLSGTNIRVNCICPGIIETGMTKVLFDMADDRNVRSKIGRINPMMRYGVAEEVAGVALFLATDDSSYVTGQAIPVCGGLTSSLPVSKRVKGTVSV